MSIKVVNIEIEGGVNNDIQRKNSPYSQTQRTGSCTNRETTGKIKLGFDIRKVYLGRLDESYREELPYNNGVEIELKPKEIKTIIFEVL